MRDALGALRIENPRHPFPVVEPGRPKALNLLGLLAHHPDLTRAYHTFNGHVLFGTTLTPRQRELLVLRVGVVRRAEYEHAQHVILGLDAGLTAEEIDRITEGPDAPGWSPVDRAMLAAVDELVADACIGEETWAVLSAELDTQQLMDVVFTVGAYELLAMAMRTFGIEMDEDLRNWKPLPPGEPG
ncbi:MAG: carboxymuconolactone decarboxylase family protein, partial [Acidimicrobiales bacterium]